MLRLDLSVVVLDVSLSEMWRRFVKFQVNVGVWETSAEGRKYNGQKITEPTISTTYYSAAF